ncbi:hypothetical protein LTR56_016480 [Elasticomyces elasticus]|nr:hypothetical protein LTR56_016480 [Elasticomyces elasticus]KAK3633487.1 hypothetical protein LTR22_020107 [Elasticomyces elasticus]
MPFSFVFCCVSEMDVAILYWQTRLMTLTLHTILSTRSSTPVFKAAPASEEGVRTAKNVLMSWQYAKASKPFGGMSETLGLLAASNAGGHEWSVGGLMSDKLRIWIRRSISGSFFSWIFGEIASDMNAAAGMLTGGPLFDNICSLFQV